jgi:hypothetical protein
MIVKQSQETTVTLALEAEALPLFFPLVQQGVGMEVMAGTSVREFLCRDLGLDSAYVEGRISTLFLDGSPVDDLDCAFLDDGMTLALSAAMPGLAGATLRRGGCLSPFRSAISYHGQAHGDSVPRRVRVCVKLFNLLVREVAPEILEKGALLSVTDAKELIDHILAESPTLCLKAQINGQDMLPENLRDIPWADPVRLTTVFAHS